MAASKSYPVTEKTLLILAAESSLDVRTVRRVVLEGGEPRSAATRAALSAAMRALGFDALASKLDAEKRIPRAFIEDYQAKHAPKEKR